MTINYTTLTGLKTVSGSIQNWVNKGDLPVTDILTEAQAWIYDRLRAREMLAQATLTQSAASGTAALPADFLDPAQLIRYAQTEELPYVYEGALYRNFNSSGALQNGTPAAWTTIALNAVFDCAVAAQADYYLTYYARPAALAVTSNETNFLTTRFPNLLRHVCLAYAYQHMKDAASSQEHFALALQAVADANQSAEQARRNQRRAKSGGSISFSTLTSDIFVEGSIRNWVSDVNVPAEIILTEAQAWIYERLRAREMLTTSVVSLAIGDSSDPAPTDFLDPLQLLAYGSTDELPYVQEAALFQARTSLGVVNAGTPARWTMVGTTLQFDVKATAQFDALLTYYARPTALSTGNETNFLTTRFPGVLRHVCLGYALMHKGELEKASGELVLAEKAIQDANASTDLARRNQRVARSGGGIDYVTLTADVTVEGSIRNWIQDANAPAEIILTEAQAWIFERLRAREMLTRATVSLTATESTDALPTDFLDPVQLIPHGTTDELPYVQEEALAQSRDSSGILATGTPARWSIVGSNIEFDMASTGNYSARLIYYARPTALSDSNTTSFLTTRYPSLLRHACLAYALEHGGKDPSGEFVLADKEIAEVNATSELNRRNQRKARSGGTVSFTTLTDDISVEGSIRNWVRNANAPADIILTEAQAYIYDRLRAREMVTRAEVALAIGDSTDAVPTDYLDPIQLLPYGATDEIPYVLEEALAQQKDSSGTIEAGTPARWTTIGTDLVFNVKASAIYGATLSYYATPTALSAGNPTNFLTSKYFSVLRHTCMAYAYEHAGEIEKAAAEFILANKAIQDINESVELNRRNQRLGRSGGTLDYTTLVADITAEGSIRNWAKDANVPATIILTEAEAWIYERFRPREMISGAAVSISASSSFALPADFLDPIQLLPYGETDELPYVQESALAEGRDAAGDMTIDTPSRWTVMGSNIRLNVTAAGTFGARLTYYAKPTALGVGNTTNFLTSRYPTLLRHTCLAFAFEHMGKADLAVQEFTLAAKAIEDTNASAELSRRNQRQVRSDQSTLTYSNLVADKTVAGSIRQWAADANVSPELILTEVEAFIYKDLRTHDMLKTASLTLNEGDDSIALPTDFLDPMHLIFDQWGEPLLYVHEARFAQFKDSDGLVIEGTPEVWTIIGGNIKFDCRAADDYPAAFTYYYRPDALSVSNPSNFVTDRFPTLVRHAAQCFAADHMGDLKMAAAKLELATAALYDANAADDFVRRGQF